MFHPNAPKFAGGAGNLIYSAEWHKCRELCGSDPLSPGCMTLTKHLYGSHLPYEPGPKASQNNSREQPSVISFAEKETMTEISLMFNPFKSELKSALQKEQQAP